jgi:hypothetical protein
MIGSLDRLLAAVQALDAGDMVVAWEPLATGLETKHEFKRIAEFRCWLSLYCHKRWQRGALRALKRQFKERRRRMELLSAKSRESHRVSRRGAQGARVLCRQQWAEGAALTAESRQQR